MLFYFVLLGHEKALSSFRKGGVEETMFNLGLARPVSDNNHTVHALMSANIQLLVWLIRSREVLIQVDQSTKDVKDAYVS